MRFRRSLWARCGLAASVPLLITVMAAGTGVLALGSGGSRYPIEFFLVDTYALFLICAATSILTCYVLTPGVEGSPECTCRRCRWVLKNLSEPRCPCCGEVV